MHLFRLLIISLIKLLEVMNDFFFLIFKKEIIFRLGQTSWRLVYN